MLPLSIVILTKNEERNITRCLNSIKSLTNDIIIVDSGSEDKTIEIANSFGANIVQENWQGYSKAKNKGNQIAKFDWILSLDADEELNDELQQSIQKTFTTPQDSNMVFSIQRKMVYCGQVLNNGSVYNEYRQRLFNRNTSHWNDNEVHEELAFIKPITKVKLNGFLWHHSYSSSAEQLERLEKYAQLNVKEMLKNRKKISPLKLYFSSTFSFLKNYIFKGGFLDGRLGYKFAKNEMWYVNRKYQLFNQIKK
jgi:glycosyltransferase involved in cell wall biosynthesis